MGEGMEVGVERVVAGVSRGLHLGVIQGAAFIAASNVPGASEGIKRTIICS
jgi:hypothetical protein